MWFWKELAIAGILAVTFWQSYKVYFLRRRKPKAKKFIGIANIEDTPSSYDTFRGWLMIGAPTPKTKREIATTPGESSCTIIFTNEKLEARASKTSTTTPDRSTTI